MLETTDSFGSLNRRRNHDGDASCNSAVVAYLLLPFAVSVITESARCGTARSVMMTLAWAGDGRLQQIFNRPSR